METRRVVGIRRVGVVSTEWRGGSLRYPVIILYGRNPWGLGFGIMNFTIRQPTREEGLQTQSSVAARKRCQAPGPLNNPLQNFSITSIYTYISLKQPLAELPRLEHTRGHLQALRFWRSQHSLSGMISVASLEALNSWGFLEGRTSSLQQCDGS